jgi:hypothetical protein
VRRGDPATNGSANGSAAADPSEKAPAQTEG